MRFLKSNLREQFFGTFLRTELGILFFFCCQNFEIFRKFQIQTNKNCLKNSAESGWENESYPQSNRQM